MKREDSHLSDQRLLREGDGELSRHEEKIVRAHLASCGQCRARRQELQNAMSDFVRAYQDALNAELPPIAGPRALLKARMAQLSAKEPVRRPGWLVMFRTSVAAAILAALVMGFVMVRLKPGRQASARLRAPIIATPNARLTPGATLLVDEPAVCAEPDTNNRAVSAGVRRKVFEEYGIQGADPRAYEVDYLVTPALGGADDIHNLWPHSYSDTLWNARVKDTLEDRLRAMVCAGRLDLAEAQHEIASNWIAAYRKYFHTDEPLAEPCRECVR
jgi:anti-sigma factor RsiW